MDQLTTEQLAVHFDISTNQTRTWKQRAGFPADACHICAADRRGYYDLGKVNSWLQSRDYSTGRRPRWLAKIKHPLSPPGMTGGADAD